MLAQRPSATTMGLRLPSSGATAELGAFGLGKGGQGFWQFVHQRLDRLASLDAFGCQDGGLDPAVGRIRPALGEPFASRSSRTTRIVLSLGKAGGEPGNLLLAGAQQASWTLRSRRDVRSHQSNRTPAKKTSRILASLVRPPIRDA